MGQPRAKTGAKLRPNRANIGPQQQQPPQPTTTTTTTTTKKKLRRPRQQQQQPQQRPQQQQEQQQQPRAKTGANLRPNRANIGRQQQQQEQRRQRQQQEQQQQQRRRRGRRRQRLQQRLPALMLASLACANSMCKMALPTSVYATYTRAVSPLRMKDAAGTPEVPAPVLHRGRLRQPPKRQ